MPARRPFSICLFLAFALAVGSAPLACSLDWAVRADPGDAGGSDVATDRSDAPATDSPTGSDAADAPASDAPVEASECESLKADIDAKKTAARICTIAGGDCGTRVNDQCGCEMFVAKAKGTAPTNDYVAAVTAFKNAGCTDPTCAGCTALPVTGTCVFNGPSGKNLCSP